MRHAQRIVIAGLAAVLLPGAALAGDEAPRPPGSVPIAKSAPTVIDRKTTELPPSALGMEDDKSKTSQSRDEKLDLKIPDEIKFGNNTLHFDANKKELVPPVGLESNGQAVINKAPTEPALQPNYFGLRLTTPIR